MVLSGSININEWRNYNTNPVYLHTTEIAGKKTYCWTNKQPWLLFYEIWDGAGDRTSCWMTLFTFLLMSQEEARFIRLERKWLVSHICEYIFTKGEALDSIWGGGVLGSSRNVPTPFLAARTRNSPAPRLPVWVRSCCRLRLGAREYRRNYCRPLKRGEVGFKPLLTDAKLRAFVPNLSKQVKMRESHKVWNEHTH